MADVLIIYKINLFIDIIVRYHKGIQKICQFNNSEFLSAKCIFLLILIN